MSEHLTLDRWLRKEEIESLKEPLILLFLKLRREAIRDLLNLKLYEYKIISRDPISTVAETIRCCYIHIYRYKIPCSYSCPNRVYFIKEIEEPLCEMKLLGKTSLLETISKRGKRPLSTLLLSILGLKLSDKLKPFEYRLTKYVVDDIFSLSCTSSLKGHEFRLNVEIVPTVRFSPRMYDMENIGIVLIPAFSMRIDERLDEIYRRELAGSKSLLREFIVKFPKQKLVTKMVRHSYGFEIIEPEVYEYREVSEQLERIKLFLELYCDINIDRLKHDIFIEGLPLSFTLRRSYGHPQKETMLLPISLLKPGITMKEAANIKVEGENLSKYLKNLSTFMEKLNLVNKFISCLKEVEPLEVDNIKICFEDSLVKIHKVVRI